MAVLQSPAQFDYNNLDFNRMLRFGTDQIFLNGTKEAIGFFGLTYEDQFRVAWQMPGEAPRLSVFAGPEILVNGLLVTGGTITAYFELIKVGSAWEYLSGIEQISTPASQVAAAVNSLSTVDDYAVLSSLFSGPDTMAFGNLGDFVRGGSGNDLIKGNGGNDYVDGGTGTDTAWMNGRRSEYVISRNADFIVVSDQVLNRDGQDTTLSVERLLFADGTLALDTAGTAGQVYRLYQAAFARTPDTAGLKHNTGLVDSGLTLQQMSSAFLASAEFQQKYGANVSDTAYINALYQNVLGRDADAGGLAGWQARLSDGTWNRTTLLIGFSESPENIAKVAGFIVNGIWLA